jgi:hypothetical protein
MAGTKDVAPVPKVQEDLNNRTISFWSKSEPNSVILEFGWQVDRGDHNHGQFVPLLFGWIS